MSWTLSPSATVSKNVIWKKAAPPSPVLGTVTVVAELAMSEPFLRSQMMTFRSLASEFLSCRLGAME